MLKKHMKLNKPLKIITGICSLFPLLYLFACIMPFILKKMAAYGMCNIDYDFVMTLIVLMVPFFIVTYGSMIFLMVHMFKNNQFADNQKLFWALILFFLNIISFPAYWYLYILKEGRKDIIEKTAGRQLVMTILFFVPLLLFFFIIVTSVVFAALNKKLGQPWIMLWAVFFDLTFFPIIIYLIVKTIKNKEFSAGKKILWICMLLLFNIFVFPVYKLKYLSPQLDQGSTQID